MRQLVSVITDSSIMFLVHDDDDTTTQIAQVTNTGLDVAAVVRLGVNLNDALGLSNGHTNGHVAERVAAPPATRALPAAKTTSKTKTKPPRKPKYKLRVDDHVRCSHCERVMRRGSLSQHGESVHGMTRDDALRMRREAVAVDAPLSAFSPTTRPPAALVADARASVALDGDTQSERRASDGRLISPRSDVAETWPGATPSGVYELLRSAPEGLSVREIAAVLADNSGRGRQTIGNKVQTLQGQGLIVKYDGIRPHFKTGRPAPTVIIKAVER